MDKLIISASLTIKELGVIRLAKEGHSNKEIAQILKIEETTVKCHRRNTMKKLGIKGKPAFVKFLHSTRLI